MMRRPVTLMLGLVLVLSATVAAQQAPSVVRVFQLRSLSAPEAVAVIHPLLSPDGTLTVKPQLRTVTVQDRADVVKRVAEVLDAQDMAPVTYRILLHLVAASDGDPPENTRMVQVDNRVRRMFRYRSYWELGQATIQGQVGLSASVKLNDQFRVLFNPQPPVRPRSRPSMPLPVTSTKEDGLSDRQPWGVPSSPRRESQTKQVLLSELVLVDVSSPGQPVLRTNVSIGPNQTVVLGATPSEGSGRALILIVEARSE